MPVSRRDFATLLARAAATLPAVGLTLPASLRGRTPGMGDGDAVRGPTGRRQAMFFQWERVSDRVRVALGGGGNAVLYQGDGEAAVTDGKNFGLGRILRREAEAHGVPVGLLVNTHHHGDHSGGNEGFRDLPRRAHAHTVPRIRATAEANLARAAEALPALREELAAQGRAAAAADVEAQLEALDGLAPDDFLPTDTFDRESQVDVGGGSLELRWVSRGHTDGDNFIFLPQENVLHTGDLFFHGRHPYVDDGAGATPDGWIRCLDAMLALCNADTVVVPGHGDLTDREGLAGQRAYFERLQAMVEEAIYEGRSRDEVTALAPEDLAALPGAERHLPRNLGIVYDEITAG